MASTPSSPAAATAVGAGTVLLTLASGQFLMALDSSVMNVSIATVAEDIGTTVTGVQTAITLYMLVMASLMITGGRVGSLIGRKRAFTLGCIIYGCGSFTTSIAPNLAVLLFGWSLLEGIGAALIMPAIVALVASNFDRSERPRAYGLVAAAGAIAVAAGPLIGGLATTYASWRIVFAGEVVVVLGILVLARKFNDAPPEPGQGLDLMGTLLSAAGLGSIVFGVLRAGEWGFVLPSEGGPSWWGLSPTVWLVLAGGGILVAFLAWERHRVRLGAPALIDPDVLDNRVLRGGLYSFFFQYLVMSGVFFVVPLFLSVSLGLTAIDTGVRLLPMSLALLAAATGVPRLWPHVSPRRVVRTGFVLQAVGIVLLVGALEVGADESIVFGPLLLIGLGVGALASQLGAVTVSSVPDDQAAEVGGLQNTSMFLGSAIGTALAGAILISALTTSFLTGVENDPDVPPDVVAQAETRLSGGAPFLSDAQLTTALDEAGVEDEVAQSIIDTNESARIDALRASLAVLALMGVAGALLTGGIPRRQQAVAPPVDET
jgi:MFS family permease